jgi:SAM-dependent methyltransferase
VKRPDKGIGSVPWDWKRATDTIWLEPAEDIFYYVARWRRQGRLRVLDLGCGLGRNSLPFAEAGFGVDAIDLSEDAVTATAAKLAGFRSCSATKADMRELPFIDGRFDCAFAYHSISHANRAGFARTVETLERVLASGAELFVTLCSTESPSYASRRYPEIEPYVIVKDEAPEIGIPHIYFDESGVRAALGNLTLIRLRKIVDYFDGGFGVHWFAHCAKP